MRTAARITAALLAVGLWLGLVAPAPAPVAENDPVQAAVRKGVRYLMELHRPLPNYNGGSHGVGSAALAGLALLESGVPENHAVIKNIAQYVRFSALKQNHTYETSLAIMFLDRLGHKGDEPLIQFLGVRLLSGQNENGGWTYDCSSGLDPNEEARLRAVLSRNVQLHSQPEFTPNPKRPATPRNDLPDDPDFADPKKPAPKKAEPKAEAPRPPARPKLHPEVAKYLKLVNNQIANPKGGGRGRHGDDNSNTQFAIMGLWCARKHGLPADEAFVLLDKRFRASQAANGGWGYAFGGGASPAMTCAGLLGLAVRHGADDALMKNRPDAPNPRPGPNGRGGDAGQDEVIKKGLMCLGTFIAESINREQADPQPAPAPKGKGKGKGRRKFRVSELNSNYYFLWSVERVAVAYGLETIGNQDWYNWGADALIESQAADGSWRSSNFPGANPEINTCLALLFLGRANLARDLSATLKGKIRDPGTSTLKSVGDAKLEDLFPGSGGSKKPPEPRPVVDPNTVPGFDPVPNPNPKPNPNPARPADPAANDFFAQARQMSDAVVRARPEDREALIAKLRDTKGSVNTEALARAAARLEGDWQKQAREALANRLTRMTASTLRDMLKDENPEVRRAASLACGMKGDKAHVPDLIAALGDADAMVSAAAHASLRALTGKDFGPEPGATEFDRKRAAIGWRNWWRTNQGKE